MLIVNSDDIAPSEFASAYQTAGVDKLSYSPPSSSLPASGWPTLGTLIDSGTRLVTFLSTTADFTSVPYMIDGTFWILAIITGRGAEHSAVHRILKCLGDGVRRDGYHF